MKGAVLGLAMLLALLATSVQGEVIMFVDTVFSGDPLAVGPLAKVTFTNTPNTTNSVDVTVELAKSEELVGISSLFVSNWYFNFKPDYDPSKLNFTWQSGQKTYLRSQEDPPPLEEGQLPTDKVPPYTGVNTFKADGDGFYDVLFVFPTNNDVNTDRFRAGDFLKYSISSTVYPITEDWFNARSESRSGDPSYPYLTAMHVQWNEKGIGKSAWIGATKVVPQPTCVVAMVGVMLSAGLIHLKRRWRSSVPN